MSEAIDLKELSCEYFQIQFQFSPEQFNESLFLESVKQGPQEDGRIYVTYGSKQRPGKQHAHVSIRRRKSGKLSASIFYTTGSEGPEPTAPQDMADCLTSFAGFLKVTSIDAAIDAGFRFSDKFSPVVALPFPIPSPHEILKGALVSGVALEFPNRPDLDRVILQRMEKGVAVQVQAHTTLEIANVSARTMIERAQRIAASVVLAKGDDVQ